MKIDDFKLEVYLLATFLKKWNLYQGFISILQYWKFGKCFQKINEVIEFTLGKKNSKAFPKICQKNENFVFGNIHWKFAWLKKKNNTWIHR